MADFKYVFKELVRGRKAIGMDDEPLIPTHAYRFTDDSIAKLEEDILQWSKENPEFKYPTWYVWLESMGVLGEFKKPGEVSVIEKLLSFYPTPKILEEIPQDMAEKLSIKPIIKGEQ